MTRIYQDSNEGAVEDGTDFCRNTGKNFAEHKRKTEELLPALIKRLINSSCPDANLRIPEEDDIWAPGYDGIVSTETGSRYVAAGNSVWELGTAADSLSKINSDYEKRTRESLGVNKAETTFILLVLKYGHMRLLLQNGKPCTVQTGKW